MNKCLYCGNKTKNFICDVCAGTITELPKAKEPKYCCLFGCHNCGCD